MVEGPLLSFPSGWLLLSPGGFWMVIAVSGWALDSKHITSLKLKEIVGRREGFRICPHQFCPHLNFSSGGICTRRSSSPLELQRLRQIVVKPTTESRTIITRHRHGTPPPTNTKCIAHAPGHVAVAAPRPLRCAPRAECPCGWARAAPAPWGPCKRAEGGRPRASRTHKGIRMFAGEGIALLGWPRGLDRWSMDLMRWPRGLNGWPEGLNGWPEGLNGWPEGLNGWPRGLNGWPEGLNGWPEGLNGWPEGLNGWPRGLNGWPRGLNGWPRGLNGWRECFQIIPNNSEYFRIKMFVPILNRGQNPCKRTASGRGAGHAGPAPAGPPQRGPPIHIPPRGSPRWSPIPPPPRPSGTDVVQF